MATTSPNGACYNNYFERNCSICFDQNQSIQEINTTLILFQVHENVALDRRPISLLPIDTMCVSWVQRTECFW